MLRIFKVCQWCVKHSSLNIAYQISNPMKLTIKNEFVQLSIKTLLIKLIFAGGRNSVWNGDQ